MSKVAISNLPAAPSVGVNDLVPSTQADGVTRKVTLGQITNLVPISLAFLDLTDTPGSYSGQSDKLVGVNGSGTGLEFKTGGAIVTADNGLNEDPPGNVQLGGALTEDTLVGSPGAGFDLQLDAKDINLLADTDVDLTALAGGINILSLMGNVLIDGQTVTSQANNLHEVKSLTGNVQIDAAVDIELTAPSGDVTITGDQDVTIQATAQTLALKGPGAGVDVDGLGVDIHGNGGALILRTTASPLRVLPSAGAPSVGDLLTAVSGLGDAEWQPPSVPGLSSADNGLNVNPAGNVRLGGVLVEDTVVGAPAGAFNLQFDAQNVDLNADNGIKLQAATGQINIAAVANPLTIDATAVTIAGTTGDLALSSGALGDVSILPGNAPAPSAGDILTAKSASGDLRWVANTQFAQWFLPFNAIADAEFPLVGEISNVASGLVADFATTTSMRGTHVSILVNSITTGGDLIVSGDSIDPNTGVVTNTDNEIVTVDTTAGQRYQTDKIWLEITGVDITSGAITGLNYDIDRLSYIFDSISGFLPTQIRIIGYTIQFQTTNNNADLGLQMFIINDAGSKKLAIDTIEDIVWTSTVGNGVITDNLRTAGNDRSFTWTVTSIGANTTFTYRMLDFNSFFSGGENIVGAASNDGLQVIFTGTGGGLNNINHGTFTLVFSAEPA